AFICSYVCAVPTRAQPSLRHHHVLHPGARHTRLVQGAPVHRNWRSERIHHHGAEVAVMVVAVEVAIDQPRSSCVPKPCRKTVRALGKSPSTSMGGATKDLRTRTA